MFKNRLRIASVAFVVAITTGLTACAVSPYDQPAYPVGAYPYPASYSSSQAYVEFGRVSHIEVFRSSERNPSGAGAVIGGVMGAVVGNQIGRGSGRALATAAGAVGGAVIGNSVEGTNRREVRESYRLSIEIDNGSYRAYDVGSPGDLRVGDRVRLQDGQISRI